MGAGALREGNPLWFKITDFFSEFVSYIPASDVETEKGCPQAACSSEKACES
jgi:hypothetical protein